MEVGSEERRLVTIFLADVVASTQLSAVNAEGLREQMARFFSIAREEIVRYGGTVEMFIGDAVMAVFGLPVIHEDDLLRAGRPRSARANLFAPESYAKGSKQITTGYSRRFIP